MNLTSYTVGHIDPWWDDQFKKLNFIYTPHKSPDDIARWHQEGYPTTSRFEGKYYDMRQYTPDFALPFLNLFDWDNTAISFFRMASGDMIPKHRDHYTRFREIFKVDNVKKINRCIVFLEDWKSGHYFEIIDNAIVNWKAGDFVVWNSDTPHMAANLGVEPRYTLQITGITKNKTADTL